MSKTASAGTMGVRRYKRYPAYRDSGVEWLGEIPASWGIKPLKRIVRFRGGGTPSKENIEYWQGSIPWVSPKDMKVSLVLDTEDKISIEAVRESATKIVPARAVLIVVRSGILIHTIPVALAGLEVTLNQDLKALITGPEIVPEYLFYLIAGMQRELLLQWKKEGATVESLEMELVANTPTPIPASSEQRAIASFLDRETAKISTLVAANERLIDLLQEKRSAQITRAVTKGLDPNVPMKDSRVTWLGEIPMHWEAIRIKHVAPLHGGYAFSSDSFQDDGVAVVRMNNLKRGILDLSDAAYIRSIDCIDAFALNEGDLLLGMSGSIGETGSLGNYAIVRSSDIPCQLNQRVGKFQFSERLQRDFLLFFMGAVPFTEPLIADSIGTAQFNISPESVGEVEIGLPPAPEQRAIASFLDKETAKLDALIAKVREAIERLKELRIALISAAVTGKIDVREEVP